ncbi:MAG: low-specificity L-threonine aldolase [Negativibacillus massiliensis]|uniref:low-specificity L-threonine aldolase n=1 Tax=Negativibacillus massiliensis TaxID=1871035 RepID=UPI00399EEABE
MEKWIDLRSDTVTQPTQEMREAMYRAQVGDDVYGDDPTMNELERKAAEMLGKEAALFMASGTMGNAVAVMSHIQRGNEVILSDTAHIVAHEVGGAAVLSQAFIRTLHFKDGLFDAEQIRAAIRDRSNIHYPYTGLICVEEPLATGKVVPLERLQKVYQMAKEENIPVHMDGARIFNAATALGVDVKEIAACTDSVMFCLSKGLCAPVGSMLVGSKEYIERARRNRKMLGGGMRQCGFLAAAGLIALEVMTKRLQEDHDNAKYMAQRLQKMPGVTLDMNSVEINMVFFKLDAPKEVIDSLPEKMLEAGVKINGIEDGEFRFVTTHDTSREDIDRALDAFEKIIKA